MESALSPQPTLERRWILLRQDDNGSTAEIRRFAGRAEAEARAAKLEARGHKQSYWVEEADRSGGRL